jgi:hypothetical protein
MLIFLCFYQTKFGPVLKLVIKVFKKFSSNHFHKNIKVNKNKKQIV